MSLLTKRIKISEFESCSTSAKFLNSTALPGRVAQVKEAFRDHNVSDLVTLKGINRDSVRIQDFFAREELSLALARSTNNYKNKILSERLQFARLMLTDQKIRLDDLMKRFQYNREYDYEGKKRMTEDGCKQWVSFPEQFTRAEQTLVNFFTALNKIQE